MMILLEANYDAILYLIIAIMFGPAILLAVIGFFLLKNNKKAAKVFFILAALYVIISLGVCGSMLM
jgi:hypothetical protein